MSLKMIQNAGVNGAGAAIDVNVGYRIIEANIQELLADPGERAGWY
ncbi:MAG: hypothetical protein ACYCZQ_15650 [Burkholderiales bacterium]